MWPKFLVAPARQIRQHCFPELFSLILLTTSMYVIVSFVVYRNESVIPHEDKDRQVVSTTHPQPRFHVSHNDALLKVEQLISEEKLKKDRENYIRKQRQILEEEMKNFEFKVGNRKRRLDDLILEKGGKPIRNLIVSTWRSGSTFLGEIVNAHPGNYYHFEPLAYFDNFTQIDFPNLGDDDVNVIRDLFYCQYNNLNYTNYVEINYWVYHYNSRLWKSCQNNTEVTRVCFDPSFISKMCRLFPIQSMKTVRMRLKLTKNLLDDTNLDIRILLLVRDPRGTMNSRSNLTNPWCSRQPSCRSEQSLCSGLEDDFHTASKFRLEYPQRFMALRYEDIALNTHNAIKKVYKFFRLEYTPVIKKYLDVHTRKNETVRNLDPSLADYSTYRDSNSEVFHWRNGFMEKFAKVKKIQTQCERAMSMWGYRLTKDEMDMMSFNPMDKPPWEEMNIPKTTIVVN